MNSLVIYGSHFGNTKKIAEAIAAELAKYGSAPLMSAEDVPAVIPAGTDLLVIGGPTEAFRMTAPVANLLTRLQPQSVKGMATAVFDTRVKPRWWLLGYAGPAIAKRLTKLGADAIAPPEGFFVEGQIKEAKGQFPTLAPGEAERAAKWAAALAESVEARMGALHR